jgi:iron complex outermembrane receptor protein
MTKRQILRAAILSGSAGLIGAPAFGQDQTQEPSAIADEAQPAGDAVRLAQAEQAQEETQPENEIRVIGLRQQYRGDVPIQDLPQSVSIISSEMLRDVGVTQLADALDLASGVNRQNNFGGIWDAYAIRGFAGDPNLPSGALVNGFNAGRGFGGPRDASNVERIEILKGPNSALFGRGEPGGTVNVVTKKPEFSPEGSFTVSGGSFDTVRFEGDYTTPLNGTIAVRANGSYNYTDNFRDVLSTTRYTVTPSVLVKLTPATILSYELEYINLKLPFDRGVVSVNGELGLVPRRRFFGEPGDGRFQINALGHQVQLQHTFNRNWNVLFGFGYRDTSFNGFSSDPEITPSRQLLYLRPDLGRMSRQRRLRDFDTKNLVVRGEVSGEFETVGIRHHLLFGGDYDEFDIDQVQMRFRPPSAAAQLAGAFGNTIDIFNPVYGTRPTPGAFRNILEKQRGWGAYFQDQVEITDAFKVRFGGRYDEYRPRTFFRPGDFNAAVGMTPQVTFTRFSPQAGAVFEVSPAFSIYAAYGEGFRPNSDTDVNSNPFEPETTRSYEVGAKFTLLGTLSGTVALFEVKKNNVLTADPINAGFSRALGSARSRGLEFDLSGELPGQVNVWLAYAYLDAEVGANAGDPNFGFMLVKGDPLLNIPKHSANILATKDFAIGKRTMMIGAGVNYVSSRLGETGINSFRLPEHTLVKLVASYELSENFKLSGEVNNVFDEVYYPSSFARLWVTPGTPRSFTARLSYSF